MENLNSKDPQGSFAPEADENTVSSNIVDVSENTHSAVRKTWKAPELIVQGTVVQMTQASTRKWEALRDQFAAVGIEIRQVQRNYNNNKSAS